MNKSTTYIRIVISTALLLLFGCHCRYKSCGYDYVDKSIDNEAIDIDETYIEGLWLNNLNNDTLSFKQAQVLNISSQKEHFMYFLKAFEKKSILQTNKIHYDTIRAKNGIVESIKGFPIDTRRFQILKFSDDTIILSSFINIEKKVVLSRIHK